MLGSNWYATNEELRGNRIFSILRWNVLRYRAAFTQSFFAATINMSHPSDPNGATATGSLELLNCRADALHIAPNGLTGKFSAEGKDSVHK